MCRIEVFAIHINPCPKIHITALGKDTILTQADLFTGTEVWYRHSLIRKILYTEGIQYPAEKAGAYWLIDEIAFSQTNTVTAKKSFSIGK